MKQDIVALGLALLAAAVLLGPLYWVDQWAPAIVGASEAQPPPGCVPKYGVRRCVQVESETP